MSLAAGRCPRGHLSCPPHPRCPDCGADQVEILDLSDRTARIVTWTVSRSTPPGVRTPNPVAIVEFEVGDGKVRAVGGLTTDTVAMGDEVRPVHVERLRDPQAGIRASESQSWDGYRFEPL